MNELDSYTLDQKSWSFLNLIGQTPLTLPVTNISASGNITVATLTASASVVTPLVQSSGLIGFGANGAAAQWQIDSTIFSFAPVGAQDNLLNIGGTSNRIKTLFTPIIDTGTTGPLSLKTNQVTRVTVVNTGQLYPATDAAAAQTASGIFAGTGVPNNANGNNGDFYFRSDGGAGTCIYQRRANVWVATGA